MNLDDRVEQGKRRARKNIELRKKRIFKELPIEPPNELAKQFVDICKYLKQQSPVVLTDTEVAQIALELIKQIGGD
jgi:hypothetical protein